MTLPTFLGIGAPRCGTTWLHELLDSHPDVYLPKRRKEVRFFDWDFKRGLQWYEKFFPSGVQASQYNAIGEFSPTYLYCQECPERITRVPTITRLILILRNPVDRAFSSYALYMRNSGSGFYIKTDKCSTFEDYLSLRPIEIQRGFYSRGIEDYYRFFDKDRVLMLVFEQAVKNVSETKESLAHFLNIDISRFPIEAGGKKASESYIPRFHSLFALFTQIAHELRRRDMDWTVNWARRFGIDERLFGRSGSLPSMKPETRQYLQKMYEDELVKLESLLGIDLECWK